MIEGLLMIGAGAMLFVIGTTMRKISKRAKSMPKPPTYSKSATPALLDFGIYKEHGMVNFDDGKSVRPQCKNSRELYESML